MVDFVPIAVSVIVIISIGMGLGYLTVKKRSKPIGIGLAAAAFSVGVVLTVNYFVEVPRLIVAAVFVALIVIGFLAAFEAARQDALRNPS